MFPNASDISSSISNFFGWNTDSNNKQDNDDSTENPQKIAIRDFTHQLESVDFSNNPVYSGLVTDLELAAFSALAYKSNEEHVTAIQVSSEDNNYQSRWWRVLHNNGWRVMKSVIGPNGFKAIAYIHENRKQVVFAFRGTVTSESITLWEDWQRVVKTNIGGHSKQAFEFIQETVATDENIKQLTQKKSILPTTKFTADGYEITLTGHSLGAWIASIACDIFDYRAVVFDNPGAKPIIEQYRKGIVSAIPADTKPIFLTSYLAKPNLINTAHKQIGRVLQLTTAAPSRLHQSAHIDEIEYSIGKYGQHSIDLITSTFDSKTGGPQRDKVKVVRAWPHGGAKAAEKIEASLPPILRSSIDLILSWYFREDISYQKWLSLFAQLISGIPSIRSTNPAQLAAETFNILTEAYAATNYDYLQMDLNEPESLEAAFNQRFKAHYHVEDLDEQSLPVTAFDKETLSVLRDIREYRHRGKIQFSNEYDYLNQIEWKLNPYSSDKDVIYIPISTGKTAADCYRELKKSLPELKEYLEKIKKNIHQHSRNITDSTTLKYEVSPIEDEVSSIAVAYSFGGSVAGFNNGRDIIINKVGDISIVPRQKLLKQIDDQFSRDTSNHDPKIVAITASHGMGKTMLATQYAHQAYQQHKYQAVIWLAAGDDLLDSYRRLAIHLLGEDLIQQKPEIWQKKLKSYLERHYGSVLFVFDDVASSHTIEPYLSQLPTLPIVDVLITTRNRELEKNYSGLFVDRFNNDEAIEYIRLNLPKHRISDTEALKLAEAADFHPLSLSCLTGYIRTENISIDTYLSRYKQQESFAIHETVNEKQTKAILLSLDKLTEQSPLARRILDVCAFLSADNISKDLLKSYLSGVSEEKIEDALTLLAESSLVMRVPGKSKNYFIHRLLQDTISYQLKQETHILQEKLLYMMMFFKNRLEETKSKLTDPNVNADDKEAIKQEHVHAESICRRFAAEILPTLSTTNNTIITLYADLLFQLGICFEETVRYDQATKHYQEALNFFKQIHRTDLHPSVARCFMELGNVFLSQGQIEQARKHYQKALDLFKKILSAKVYSDANVLPDMARCLVGIGDVFFGMEQQLAQAKKHYQQALNIFSEQGHPINIQYYPHMARCLMSLGNVYRDEKQFEQAHEHYQKALTIYEQVYSTNIHPDVARCFMELGDIYRDEEQFEQAYEYYQKALDFFRQIHRTDMHPTIATCLMNFGIMFCREKQFKKAIEKLQQAIDIFRQTLGDSHPEIEKAKELLSKVEQLEKIRESLQDAVERSKQTLGDSHPETEKAKELLKNFSPDQPTDNANKRRGIKIFGEVKAEESLALTSSIELLMQSSSEEQFLSKSNRDDSHSSLSAAATLLLGGGATTYMYTQHQRPSHENTPAKTYPFDEQSTLEFAARGYRTLSGVKQPTRLQSTAAITTQPTNNNRSIPFNYSCMSSHNFFACSTTPSSNLSAHSSKIARLGGRTGAILGGTIALGVTLHGGWQMMRQKQQFCLEEANQTQTNKSTSKR